MWRAENSGSSNLKFSFVRGKLAPPNKTPSAGVEPATSHIPRCSLRESDREFGQRAPLAEELVQAGDRLRLARSAVRFGAVGGNGNLWTPRRAPALGLPYGDVWQTVQTG